MKTPQKPDPRSYLPLKPDVFLILTILGQEDQYGYGIMQAAEGFGGPPSRIQAGALYRRLKWMLVEGLIQELGERPGGEDGERRRYYRLTALGRSVAEAEAQRMSAHLAAAKEARLFESLDPAEGT